MGQILADDFQIGKVRIKDQPIHVGLKVNIPVIESAKWDGIVGLGYWHANPSEQLDKDKSIIDNIIERNLVSRKVFSYYIKPEQGGRATFGEVLKDIVPNENDLLWANVEAITDEAQWMITLKNIHLEFDKHPQEKRFGNKLKEKKDLHKEQLAAKAQQHIDKQQEWIHKRLKKENPCA